MKYQRHKPFIMCVNYDPELTLTYFKARSNLVCNLDFTWENVTLMDSFEFIASCDMEFG